MKRLLVLFSSVTLVLFIIFSFTTKIQDDEWVVPESAKNMENPTDAGDDENLEIAKSLYDKHCKSCHGKEGLGDGPKSEELDTFAGDFTTDLSGQTDGALFYKITEGRDDMPNFDKKLADEEDRWILVHYIRTFSE